MIPCPIQVNIVYYRTDRTVTDDIVCDVVFGLARSIYLSSITRASVKRLPPQEKKCTPPTLLSLLIGYKLAECSQTC